MTLWDESFDLVIVGSGGGGLVASLAALDANLSSVVIEKQGVVGGSTAMSGGVLWVPNNPMMKAAGVFDSHQNALDYFDSVVGDPDGSYSSLAKRESFLNNAVAVIEMLTELGVQLIYCPGYSDYYDNRPGGIAAGRSVEGIPWDARQLGEGWRDKVNPGVAKAFGLVLKTNELRHLPMLFRSFTSFRIAARVYARTQWSRLRKQELLTNGMSLVGQTLKVVLDNDIPVWINAPVDDLVEENGRVVGVRVTRNGIPITVEARKGVLLSAGGFEHNADMRSRLTADTQQPSDGRWSIGNPGNTGEILAAAMRLGAKTDLLDEAWWQPMPRPELQGSAFVIARQQPSTIFVDNEGRRFVNESNSYVEVGKAMYANDAVPCWLITDDSFRARYPMVAMGSGILARARPGRMPKEWVEQGWLKRADTIEELASMIDIDPQSLVRTIERWNEGARKGLDPDFRRGESAFNAALGDPRHKPNHAVGAIEKGPYYATEIYACDIGTCGGVVTDEFARVIGPNDEPIPGLYAAGNITATVAGRTYPGAGISIANTMAFGYAAARHAAGKG